MLSKKIKVMTSVALLGFCASIFPSQAHHPSKVHIVHPVHPVYLTHPKRIVVVTKPVVAVTPRRVVVVKPKYKRPVVRVTVRH